ncbi:MAG: ribosome biogenesis GTPase YlqF [Clostridia bacterium]|nr:ribosome biogenesis GTPase YlqF [Clostridia bacterium]
MAKTKRKIKEDLKLIDVVVELLDSRIPISSQNPDIAEITKGKKKIIILNKSDLSDEIQNKKWIEYFKTQGTPAVLTDANTGRGIKEAIKLIEQTMKEDLEKLAQKGRVGRKIRAMILGIPNVGKSSLINRIAKKGAVQVANRPGVTRQNQWIRINDNIELLDTPGVLWPKFESQEVALNLAFTGTIKDNILERTDIAYYLIKYLLENYRENLLKRYKIKPEEVEEILNRDEPENVNIYDIVLLIGKKRGAIMSGGNIDEEKTARIILDEFRSGTIGKITLEKCVNGDGLN